MKYDAVVIGMGQGGERLAKKLAHQNWKVAIIERDPKMYGGTCPNIGCIPTKVMWHDASLGKSYDEIMQRRAEVVKAKNKSHYESTDAFSNIDILDGTGSFVSNHVVAVEGKDGRKELEADHIFIDTGSVPVYPPIAGLKETKHVYDSTSIQELDELPERLGIIGGGNIGLEFASIYATMGSDVTVFETSDTFMAKEDSDIAAEVQKVLEEKGIRFFIGEAVSQVEDSGQEVLVRTESGKEEVFSALLVSTGRKPATDSLNLKATAIELGERGEVKVNDQLETTVEKVYALGDVKGGLQFTYITKHDADLIYNQLVGDKSQTLSGRQHVPYTVFIDPPLARVGLTEQEAREQGYTILVNKAEVKSQPVSDVLNDKRGVFKAVVNKENSEVLGVSFFGAESPELVNQVKMALDNHIPYTYLRDQIITHPVMAEIFNTLFDMPEE